MTDENIDRATDWVRLVLQQQLHISAAVVLCLRHHNIPHNVLCLGLPQIKAVASNPFSEDISSLNTKGTEADVRQVIRGILRRKLEDERGRQFAYDLQEDIQLQQGILNLLESMSKKPAEIAEYSWIKPLPAPGKKEEK